MPCELDLQEVQEASADEPGAVGELQVVQEASADEQEAAELQQAVADELQEAAELLA